MPLPTEQVIITIDGPAGSGKTTTARLLAKRLKTVAFSTGALYRAVTWYLLKFAGLDKQKLGELSEDVLSEMLKEVTIKVTWTSEGEQKVYVNGIDVTGYLQDPIVEECVSVVSRIRVVREFLLPVQRKTVKDAGRIIVVEGRDTGSVVFPDALLKIYLTASEEKRAMRRCIQYGLNKSIEAVKKDIRNRDRLDRLRKIAPLVKPSDAVEISTDELSPEEVVEEIVKHLREKLDRSDLEIGI